MGAAAVYTLVSLGLVSSSPIQNPTPYPEQNIEGLPKGFCFLPSELGQGKAVLVEDCNNLDTFERIPKPESGQFYKFGTHAIVCCPGYSSSAIFFPSDPSHPEYGAGEDFDYVDGPVFDTDIQIPEIPKFGDDFCPPGLDLPGLGTLSECVTLDSCPAILDNSNAPLNQTLACGFDTERKIMKICCPPALVKDPVFEQIIRQEPRFPDKRGEARKVEDLTPECKKWRRYGACELDRDFNISSIDTTQKVINNEMFDFMLKACPGACEWADGCFDEHPRCAAWARDGMCLQNGLFMAHTCRESCGVCGFLSSANSEEQTVGSMSYSDYKKDNFDCGRFKLLTEINGEENTGDTDSQPMKDEIPEEDPTFIEEDILDLRQDDKERQKRQTEIDDDFVFYFTLENKGDYFCGATIINDRWIVAAAHCYNEFDTGASNEPREIKINTIRDNTPNKELIEMKKAYIHPHYKYPSLYDDIAVVELGRRIVYDYDKFGDTPFCLDQGEKTFFEEIATVQGYGLTEDGANGALLETNVTIINNQQCLEQFESNITDTLNKATITGQLCKALPTGLNDGFLCARGIENDEEPGVFSGSCKGDSGGPLIGDGLEDKRTLIGIVSGGLGCGEGYPGWYTKVAFHKDWISCIIDMSAQFSNNQQRVEEVCNKRARRSKRCAKPETEIKSQGKSVCVNDPNYVSCGSDDYDDLDLRDGAGSG